MDTSDRTLIRYLLGDLPPAETEALDERSVVDAEFADRLRGVEHDLADAYARGELPAADRQRWEQTIGTTAAGLEQLRLAEALAARERRAVPLRFQRRQPRRIVKISMLWVAAASLALAVAAGYSINRDSSAPASLTPSPATAPIVLRIPAGARDATVTLPLASDGFQRYAVDVRDLSSNRVVWSGTDLSPVARDGARALVCVVPADVLAAGRFSADVRGITPRQSDVLASYALRVER